MKERTMAIKRAAVEQILEETASMQADLDHLRSINAELLAALKAVASHITHTGACLYWESGPDGDFCSCGLDKRVNQVRTAITNAEDIQ